MSQPKSLQPGTQIDDYEIKETLWTTNSGFIYRATELDRDRDVLIQEYLPPTLAMRHWSGIHAMPLDKLQDEFDQGLTQFLREARTLAQINDPYVCRVYEYMETNATAYMVLDYEPGQTLKDHLASRKTPLDEGEIRRLLVPLLKGLRVAHSADLLHRDIHPANIYLRNVGPPVLIGFGSPEVAPRDDSEQHIESHIAPGYSPVEQYQTEGKLGPWSDLYALGATMYRCLSGATPMDATRRVTDIAQDKDDPLVPAMELGASDYSAALLSAIDWMLEPMAAARPSSAGDVLGPLTAESPASRAGAAPAPTPSQDLGRERATEDPPGKPKAPQPAPPQYRDHSKRRTAAPRPAPVADKPRPETPVRLSLDVRDTRQRKTGIKTGWGWPILVVAAGISLLAFFVFYKPPSSESVAVVEALQEGELATAESAAPKDESDPPPEIPERVNFGQERDDERAAEYRNLERRTEQIEQTLAAAESDMQQGRLVSPPGENALAKYRSILDLDPNQADAKLGIAAIQKELIGSAKAAFAEANLEETKRLLDQAAELDKDNDRLVALRQEIEDYEAEQARLEELAREEERRREEERQRAEQERLDRIRSLIAQADTALAAGRLTQPPGNNALSHYRTVLGLDPDNALALEGVNQIGRQFLDDASNALAKDELDEADGLLNTAAAILPDNESIQLLQRQLETRRAVAEQLRQDASQQAAQAENQPDNQEAGQEQNGEAGQDTAQVDQANRQPDQAPPTQARQAAVDTRQRPAAPPLEPPGTQGMEEGVDAYYAGDYVTAFRLLNPIAEKEARAKFRIAMMYYHGRGTTRDVGLAEALIREALPEIRALAEGNTAWAQADLGSLYADGIVLAENDREAARLYTLAARQGYAGAQTNLGVMYANGEGVTRNREDAILWLRRAAAQGDRIAKKNLLALGVQ